MVEIGDRPVLWHIMKLFDHYGLDDFVVCAGYKAHVIVEWFADYRLLNKDVAFDFSDDTITYHDQQSEKWRVRVVDTGASTMTGGRLRRVKEHIGDGTFCMTYGDGVANVNIQDLIHFHQQEGREATMTVVQPPGRFGAVALRTEETAVKRFKEKPDGDGAWINGGYFVLEPGVIDRITDDATIWEQAPLQSLARDGELSAYRHTGFWHPMDTLHDVATLEALWESGQAPWKVW
jgi:glucose-1-phosphate cytidylyltransferase